MPLAPDDTLFLQTICRYFHENGEWPTLRWLEGELDSHIESDVLDLENRLHRETLDTRYPRLNWDPERRVNLTALILGFCFEQHLYPEIKEDLDAFVSLVRFCVSKYINDVKPFTMTDSEARTILGMSKVMSRKVFLLAESDSNMWRQSSSKPDENGHITEWTFQISHNIRVYRKVQTIEEYWAKCPKPPIVNRDSATNPEQGANLSPASPNTNIGPINALQTQKSLTSTDNTTSHEYDVAISFAGPQRELAEQLATLVQNAGFRVFYDKFYTPDLWGTELTVSLDEVYRKKHATVLCSFHENTLIECGQITSAKVPLLVW